MVESTSGLSPVAVRRHGNTQGRGGSMSSINPLVRVRDHHVRAEKKHQLKREHLNATSSSNAAAVVGTSSSNALFESASKDAAKKLKGKETDSSNRNVVDLTLDSPRKDETRLASAVNNASSGLSFLRRGHRINRTHKSPIVSNEGHNQQVAFKDDGLLLGSGSKQNLVSNPSWQALLAPGEKNIEVASNQKLSEMGGDVSLNARSSCASFASGRKDVNKLSQKPDENSAGPSESSNNVKGKSPIISGVEHQARGHPSEPLLFKRKRSPIIDAAKSRQRFKPPRMVRGGSTSGPSFGGMQRPINVDDLEDPNSPSVENDRRALEMARQIEEDEMLAKSLQLEYGSAAIGGSYNMDDGQLAQMLQDEENALILQQRAQSTSRTINAATLQAARREVRRVLPTVRSPAARPTASSSRMRILRNLHNRSSQQHVMRSRHIGGRRMNADEHLLHFPEGLGLEARLEFLAALETASQADLSMLDQVDRDFNEDDYEMLLALDDTNHASSGASYDKIEQLPVSVIKPTDVVEENCSICLETPVVDDVVRRLPCMHVFHLQCIDEWLERQANCPICKMEL